MSTTFSDMSAKQAHAVDNFSHIFNTLNKMVQCPFNTEMQKYNQTTTKTRSNLQNLNIKLLSLLIF